MIFAEYSFLATIAHWSGSPTHLLLTSRYMSVGEPDNVIIVAVTLHNTHSSLMSMYCFIFDKQDHIGPDMFGLKNTLFSLHINGKFTSGKG